MRQSKQLSPRALFLARGVISISILFLGLHWFTWARHSSWSDIQLLAIAFIVTALMTLHTYLERLAGGTWTAGNIIVPVACGLGTFWIALNVVGDRIAALLSQ
jgi:hypothetical protein